ncbi:hypothetical protein CLOM_g4665 [Closterium sp. NIES-68]|nr:hypothetical protein CLOM_g4665 [Closterium sp. NIES-68]GJP57695.1 hypothetical protein CLOP_g17111 [Closterium sp. NIES-67]
MREVCDGVFIGNLADATSARMLERAHITRLLSLCPVARSSSITPSVTVTPPPTEPESTANSAEIPAVTNATAGGNPQAVETNPGGIECDNVRRDCDEHGRQCLTVDLLDMDDADLLAALPSCLAFVEESVGRGEKVLVHCHAGVSRSAAVVTAYLMKLHRSTTEDALRLLQSKHPLASPNNGFLHQLRMFHSMGWAVNPHHSDYSRFKLQLLARRITGTLHQGVPVGAATNGDACSGDAQLRDGTGQNGGVGAAGAGAGAAGAAPAGAAGVAATAGAGPSNEGAKVPAVYRCRKCRKVVAAAANVLPHAPKQPVSSPAGAAGAAAGAAGAGPSATGAAAAAVAVAGNGSVGGGGRFRGKGKEWGDGAERGCTSVFVEPLKWMGDVQSGQIEGKLSCSQCSTRLGYFNWSGAQCSCGEWVTPAFQLHKKCVDESWQ